MMKLRDITNNIWKTIPAAVGGLFLSVFLYGCGYTGAGETIIIAAKEQKAESASDETRSAALEHSGRLQYSDQQIYSQQLQNSERQQISGQIHTKGQGTAEGQETEEAEETLIRVYVCGAVNSPGVVEIPAGSRVEDALLKAGGFAADAAPQAVNLADWIEDGQMLYFPTKAEAEEMKGENAGVYSQSQAYSQYQAYGSNQASGSNQKTGSGLVNINTADAAALATLPGIGESRAKDIISYREKNGAFVSCEDIMKVSGIKTNVYEKICDKITVK